MATTLYWIIIAIVLANFLGSGRYRLEGNLIRYSPVCPRI